MPCKHCKTSTGSWCKHVSLWGVRKDRESIMGREKLERRMLQWKYISTKHQRNLRVLLHLCPAAGYLALKKYHDLESWPWPTCRSILDDEIRNNKKFQPEVFFFEFTNSSYIYFFKTQYLEICHFRSENIFLRIPSPRIPRQVRRVQISRSCDFFKRDIQPRGIFITLYFFRKTLYYKFVNSEKNTSGWKIFFLRIPSPRIPRQVGQGQISRSWYFLSEISSRGS